MIKIAALPESVIPVGVRRAETIGVETQPIATIRGDPGPYYTPAVSQAGDLSWTNNGGLDNPEPVNIKGPPGSDATIEALSNLEIAALLT